MDTITAIEGRKAFKNFEEHSLPKVIIESILELATKAPSIKNRQPCEYAVVMGDNIKNLRELISKSSISENLDFTIIENSAAVIFILNRFLEKDNIINDTTLLDSISIGTSIQNILLSTQSFGLGATIISDFYNISDDITSWLKLKGTVMSAILIGFPSENLLEKTKKSHTEVTKWFD